MDTVVITNRKARRDYQILKTQEVGVELRGSEVKSIRIGRANLNDSFARVEKDEILLYNMHVTSYAQASYLNEDPVRTRRLLLHKGQIRKLAVEVSQRGLTLIPLKLYFNSRGFVKLELALAKGKRVYDRRRDIKRKEIELEIRRNTRNRT